MIKTLTKHGNSSALVIERPILELLGATPETSFEVVTDGRALVLIPILDESQTAKFRKTMESIGKRYRKSFEELAKR